ncbi:MAG TPA: RNA polymerase sigma factor [Myxococcaceae bacterium]|jgi:RNA polymerase sigma-70 factor (ECF subfamily)
MEIADFERALPDHLPALRGLARRLIGNPDDAEDVVQEALLRASRSLAGFRGESSLKTWLFSITARIALDHLRSAKRWGTQVMVDACDERGRESVGAKFGDPSVSFDVGQHIAFCFTCVGRSLDPLQHAALVLREVCGLENAEAARVLDLTEPTYRHALAGARAAMKAEYEGLCALVNKNGACYQCRALREMAPESRKGPPLPPEPLAFDERLLQVRAAAAATGANPRLNDYFFAYVRQMQAAR